MIKQLTEKSNIKRVIGLGIGSFSTCSIARFQLAFILAIISHFDIQDSLFFDPNFSAIEQNILKDFNLQITADNLEGKYEVSDDIQTLLYFPHCSKQLINNFFWKNWHKDLLSNTIYIGNSFEYIITTTLERLLQSHGNYLVKIKEFTEEIPIHTDNQYTEVFNNTSIHFFPKEKLHKLNESFWTEDNKEPSYTDLEIILSDLKI